MFKWIKKQWDKFEAWVASWLPGAKTKVVAFLGFLGSAAYAMQGFVAGIPVDKLVTGTQLAMITTVLFALAYWFRGIGDRAEARN